ncbi:MAG: hypothetical protein GF401_09760 [Chitinivibrionales bacterium]|nr:hypothetical protein [Chitinivibrionales bacterium]
MKMFLQMCLISLVVIGLNCQKKGSTEKELVKIGRKVFTQQDYDAFQQMRMNYPMRMTGIFPGNRSNITFMVETEVVYREKARGSEIYREVINGDDLKWKKKFYPAQLYLRDILDRNLGFSNDKIKEYYNKHKSRFKDTVKVYDTLKVAKTEEEMEDTSDTGTSKDSLVARDSVYTKALVQVRPEIVEEMFVKENPPSPEHYEKFVAENDSTQIDSVKAHKEWIYSIKNDLPTFFMKKTYKEIYKEEFPESMSEWYGKGKKITPDDMEVILGWIPEAQREHYREDSAKIKNLAEWLLKWELFSKRAEDIGYSTTQEMKQILDWVEKYDVTDKYIEEKLYEKAEEAVTLDTAMCMYAFWDDRGAYNPPPDTEALKKAFERYNEKEVEMKLEGKIYEMRSKAGVSFLQEDFNDEKDKDPDTLLAKANTARDSGKTDEAENLYSTLVKSFPFTEEGHEALAEYAKIQTEKERYHKAIRNYRKYLMLGDAGSTKKCNTFFMVGFIYDEYLSKPEMAEINYKWVLEHSPDCELADDAEFMVQHLDEPMTSVEELRGEAERQGRIIEDTEPVEESSVDAMKEEAAETQS